MRSRVRSRGGRQTTILKVARDTVDEIRAPLNEAMQFDAVLSTGGVSVGSSITSRERSTNSGCASCSMASRRDRPSLKFGTVGYRPIFGLPGNPVSTMVCFYLYARPALLKMAGRTRVGLPRVKARCAVDNKNRKT